MVSQNSIIAVLLYMIATLHSVQVSCELVSFIEKNPQQSITEGTVLILICKVKDVTKQRTTTIAGSRSIFDCLTNNTVTTNRISLRHVRSTNATGHCGDLISGSIVESDEPNGLYTTQVNITTTIGMNGGYVECSLGNNAQRITLPDIIAPLVVHVEFQSDHSFSIYWNQANEGTTQVSNFSTNVIVIGDNCGNCTNLNRNVSSVTNHLSCTGWEPNGQVCNITVMKIASGKQLSSSRIVYLQTPTAPLLEELIPVYSHDLEELHNVEILLAVESTVDPNGLPITFQGNVERSSRENTPINCSFNAFAENNCKKIDGLKYVCEINFTVRNCPQLLKQEADYQIRLFAETIIGRSLNYTNSSVLAYDNVTVRLLFEPGDEFNYISIIFPQVIAEVSSMIKYGPNCQDNQASSVALIAKIMTFPVSIINNICFIVHVKINNTFAIQGNFSKETPTSSDTGTSESTTSITGDATTPNSTIILAVLLAVLLAACVIVLILKLRKIKCFATSVLPNMKYDKAKGLCTFVS